MGIFASGNESLDELIDSIPIIRDSEDPGNKTQQAFTLPIKFKDGVLHAMYLRKGLFVERPIGFSYEMDGEQRFTLSERLERVPLIRGNLIIPLTAHEQGLPVSIDPHGNPIPEKNLHGLGIKVDDENVLPLFLSNADYRLTLLFAEQEYDRFTYPEGAHRHEITAAIEPVLIAEANSKTGFWVGAKALHKEMAYDFRDTLGRRDMIRRAAHASVAIAGYFAMIGHLNTHPDMRKQPYESSEVSEFASHLVFAAEGTPAPDYLNIVVDNGGLSFGRLMGFGMTSLIIVKPGKYFTPAFYGTAAAAALTGRSLDVYSTIVFSRTMQDPRFREYGLDTIYFERNAALPAHPLPKDLLSPQKLLDGSKLVALGTANIANGMDLGEGGYEVFFHNLRLNHTLKLAMDIGDQVKYGLGKGQTIEQIIDYLNTVRANGLERANELRPIAELDASQRSPLVSTYFNRFGIAGNPRA